MALDLAVLSQKKEILIRVKGMKAFLTGWSVTAKRKEM
jgi:hypothetical protein